MYDLEPLADGLTCGRAMASVNPASVRKAEVGAVTAVLHRGDCLTVLKGLRLGTVDLVLVDLPYGVSQDEWDSGIPLEPL